MEEGGSMEGEAKSGGQAAIIALVGGVVMAVGSLLAWAKVSINLVGLNQSETVKGIDGSDGKITIVLGVVIVVLAALALGKLAKKATGWIITGCAVIATGLGAWDWTDIKSKGDDIVHQAAAAAGGNADVIKMLEDGIKVSTGIGLYLVVLGGIMAIVGGIMLATKKSAATAAAPPSTPWAPPPTAPPPPPPPPA